MKSTESILKKKFFLAKLKTKKNLVFKKKRDRKLKQISITKKFRFPKIPKQQTDTSIKYLNLKTLLSLSSFLLLIYFQYYRLAIIPLGYLLIENNLEIRTYFEELAEDEKRFNVYYKKTFPIFYYTLKPLILFGSIGILFSLYYLNVDLYEYVYKIEVKWGYPEKFVKLENSLFFFSAIFFPALLSEVLISLYVIKYANHWIINTMVMVTKKAVIPMGAGVTGLVLVAEAPTAPNMVSNFVHTQTPFGRGFDCERGDFLLKLKVGTLQSKVGLETITSKIAEHCDKLETPQRMVTPAVYESLLKDPEIKDVIDNKCTFLERQTLGIEEVPEAIKEEIARSVKASIWKTFRDIPGQAVDQFKTSTEWVIEHTIDRFKNESINPGEGELDDPLPAPDTPGGKAMIDQDLEDARRRNVGNDNPTNKTNFPRKNRGNRTRFQDETE